MSSVPVLGPEGWVDASKKKLDYLMAHLYASDSSQTFFFKGKVSSMSKVVKDNQGNLEKCREEVQLMLTEYFNRYFNNVEVTVYIPNGNESFHKGELVLSAELTNHDGTIVQLHEVMTDKGTLTRKFLDYQS